MLRNDGCGSTSTLIFLTKEATADESEQNSTEDRGGCCCRYRFPFCCVPDHILNYDQPPQVEWGAMLNLETLPDDLGVRIGESVVHVYSGTYKEPADNG